VTDSSPFERFGGAAAVAAVVDAFYDLVDGDVAYSELRRMHGADLTPTRRALTAFLSGWMGGPRDWFDQNPGKCMISLHAALPITARAAGQWVDAMRAAIASCGIEPKLASRLGDVFDDLAKRMTRLSA
jgi:hemoglobin